MALIFTQQLTQLLCVKKKRIKKRYLIDKNEAYLVF